MRTLIQDNGGRRTFSTFFQKGLDFGHEDYQFCEYLFTQICCVNNYEFMNG